MTSPETSPTDQLETIEADIARHRAELGTTVDELARRVDVRARARQRLAHTRSRASVHADRLLRGLRAGEPRAVAVAAAPVLAVGAAVAVALRFRGRR